jgi:hypothetical protein
MDAMPIVGTDEQHRLGQREAAYRYTTIGLFRTFHALSTISHNFFVENWLSKRVKKSQLTPMAQFRTESAKEPLCRHQGITLTIRPPHHECTARDEASLCLPLAFPGAEQARRAWQAPGRSVVFLSPHPSRSWVRREESFLHERLFSNSSLERALVCSGTRWRGPACPEEGHLYNWS